MKRLFSILMTLLMLYHCIPVSNVFAVGSNTVYSNDFSSDISKLTNNGQIALDFGITKQADNDVLYIKNNGSGHEQSGRAYLTHDTVTMPTDENIVYVSFDMMLPKLDYYGQIVVGSASAGGATQERAIYTITSGGKVLADRAYSTESEPKTGYPVAQYKQSEWNTFAVEINKSRKLMSFYINGTGYGMLFYTGEWGENITLRFDRHTSEANVENTMYIDNIIFGYGEDMCLKKSECEVDIVCDKLGQAFFEKTVDFGVSLENNTASARNYDVNVKFVNDLGTIDFEADNTVEVAAYGSENLNYVGEATRYGVNTLIVEAKDTSTGKSYTKTTEIVTLKKSNTQNPKVGICDHTALFGDGFERVSEKMAFFKNCGISSIRDMAPWVDWEKTVGVYEMPQKYKTVFDAAKANNLDLFAITGMHNYLVAPGERPPHSDDAIEAFGKYAYNMAEDTLAYGNQYEIYNEWNIPSFNLNELPPEDYLPLLQEAYEQIKDVDTGAKVYGLSGLSLPKTETYYDYAERMFKAGVANYCDGFTVHPYCHTESPDGGKAVEAVEFIRELMKQYNAEDKELILSEMGWQSAMYSTEKIASWVVKYSVMTYDLADRIYWYTSQEKLNQGEQERSFGLMMDANEFADYVPYAPKKPLIAISNYNSHMSNAVLKQSAETADGKVVVYSFELQDGANAHIAWVKDGYTENVSLAVDADNVIVEDLYGNATELSGRGGQILVALSNEPQYILVGDEVSISDKYAYVAVADSENRVFVSGSLGLANENIAVYVEKDNTLKYVNQIKTDATGSYSLSFPIDKEYGIYSLTLGTLSNGTIPLNFSFDIEAYDIVLTKGGAPVVDIAAMSDGDIISVELERNTSLAENSSVIVAQYDNEDRLIKCEIFSPNDESIETEIASDNITDFRVYVWDMIKLQPQGDEYSILN